MWDFVTVHSSYLLRIPDPDRKAREYRQLVDDLRKAAISAGRPRDGA